MTPQKSHPGFEPGPRKDGAVEDSRLRGNDEESPRERREKFEGVAEEVVIPGSREDGVL